ncbi:50S ribosomal protein L11 methyltransferase [Jannaschia aquimarina]|uniref:Ribosomal protein L11 methyltransferase n=1 Tax=Jannaschia aquimarina TaxID=935700 RepID=A0A0D1D982_9RHOB|nr:50S ribosomal protein L11 methyltransferase [Jannaschia aquimarina]KIT16458.1 Ribosomal protein L11 methyltransferase [Jannaschia aquimarina]SNS92863.1 [LSU ribosomal protein L11P]-lysine N-methyltransferase [Jannaschia aquimarina]
MTDTPATWTALTTLPGRDAAEALGERMERLDPEPQGIGVFELEDGSGLWEVGGYFTETPDGATLDLLAAAFGAKPFTVSALPPTDWVAHVRRELHPVEAGRFVVHGAHDADALPAGKVPLLIEASLAFGTGHHGTTQGCLLAIEDLAATDNPARIADIGAGTAVLAMAAAHVWPDAQVVASDMDPVAIDVAQANLAVNAMADRIATHIAAGFDHDALRGPFDLILANILKGPLVQLAPDAASACAPGGAVVLSGLLTPQAEEVIAAYADQGLTLEHRREIGDWTTLRLRKG